VQYPLWSLPNQVDSGRYKFFLKIVKALTKAADN
jgi:hypothetical protein